MKTATVREIRTRFPRIEAWLRDGEVVQVTKRGHVIAQIARPSARRTAFRMPDFAGRLARIFGNRTLSAEESAAILADSRGERS